MNSLFGEAESIFNTEENDAFLDIGQPEGSAVNLGTFTPPTNGSAVGLTMEFLISSGHIYVLFEINGSPKSWQIWRYSYCDTTSTLSRDTVYSRTIAAPPKPTATEITTTNSTPDSMAGLARDPAEERWYTIVKWATNQYSVEIYEDDGTHEAHWEAWDRELADIDIHGDRVYVTELGTCKHFTIRNLSDASLVTGGSLNLGDSADPQGIAASLNRIYVLDNQANKIRAFNGASPYAAVTTEDTTTTLSGKLSLSDRLYILSGSAIYRYALTSQTATLVSGSVRRRYEVRVTQPTRSEGTYTVTLNPDTVPESTTYQEGPNSASISEAVRYNTRTITSASWGMTSYTSGKLTSILTFPDAAITGLSTVDIEVLNSDDVVQTGWTIETPQSGNPLADIAVTDTVPANREITVKVTPPANTNASYKLRLKPNSVGSDGGTDNAPVSALISDTVLVDNRPAVSVNSFTGPNTVQASTTVEFTLTFDRSVPADQLGLGDFSTSLDSARVSAVTPRTGLNSIYNVTVTQPTDLRGSYTVKLREDAIPDSVGNNDYKAGPTAAQTSDAVTFDTRTAVIVSDFTGPVIIQRGMTTDFNLILDRAVDVNALAISDFTVSPQSISVSSIVPTLPENGQASLYTVTVTNPTQLAGNYTIFLNANAVEETDTYKRGPTGNSNSLTVRYDTIGFAGLWSEIPLIDRPWTSDNVNNLVGVTADETHLYFLYRGASNLTLKQLTVEGEAGPASDLTITPPTTGPTGSSGTAHALGIAHSREQGVTKWYIAYTWGANRNARTHGSIEKYNSIGAHEVRLIDNRIATDLAVKNDATDPTTDRLYLTTDSGAAQTIESYDLGGTSQGTISGPSAATAQSILVNEAGDKVSVYYENNVTALPRGNRITRGLATFNANQLTDNTVTFENRRIFADDIYTYSDLHLKITTVGDVIYGVNSDTGAVYAMRHGLNRKIIRALRFSHPVADLTTADFQVIDSTDTPVDSTWTKSPLIDLESLSGAGLNSLVANREIIVEITPPVNIHGNYRLKIARDTLDFDGETGNGPLVDNISNIIELETRPALEVTTFIGDTGDTAAQAAETSQLALTFNRAIASSELTVSDFEVIVVPGAAITAAGRPSPSVTITTLSITDSVVGLTITREATTYGSYTVSLKANSIPATTSHQAGPKTAVSSNSITFERRPQVGVVSFSLPPGVTGRQFGPSFKLRLVLTIDIPASELNTLSNSNINLSSTNASVEPTKVRISPRTYDLTINVVLNRGQSGYLPRINVDSIPESYNHQGGPATGFVTSVGIDFENRDPIRIATVSSTTTQYGSNVQAGVRIPQEDYNTSTRLVFAAPVARKETATSTFLLHLVAPSNRPVSIDTDDFTTSDSEASISTIYAVSLPPDWGKSANTDARWFAIEVTNPRDRYSSYHITIRANAVPRVQGSYDGGPVQTDSTAALYDTRSQIEVQAFTAPTSSTSNPLTTAQIDLRLVFEWTIPADELQVSDFHTSIDTARSPVVGIGPRTGEQTSYTVTIQQPTDGAASYEVFLKQNAIGEFTSANVNNRYKRGPAANFSSNVIYYDTRRRLIVSKFDLEDAEKATSHEDDITRKLRLTFSQPVDVSEVSTDKFTLINNVFIEEIRAINPVIRVRLTTATANLLTSQIRVTGDNPHPASRTVVTGTTVANSEWDLTLNSEVTFDEITDIVDLNNNSIVFTLTTADASVSDDNITGLPLGVEITDVRAIGTTNTEWEVTFSRKLTTSEAAAIRFPGDPAVVPTARSVYIEIETLVSYHTANYTIEVIQPENREGTYALYLKANAIESGNTYLRGPEQDEYTPNIFSRRGPTVATTRWSDEVYIANQLTATLTFLGTSVAGIAVEDFEILNSSDCAQPIIGQGGLATGWTFSTMSDTALNGIGITIRATPPDDTNETFRFRIKENSVNSGGGSRNAPVDRAQSDEELDSTEATRTSAPVAIDNRAIDAEATWSNEEFTSGRLQANLTFTGAAVAGIEATDFEIVDSANRIQAGWTSMTIQSGEPATDVGSTTSVPANSAIVISIAPPSDTNGYFKLRLRPLSVAGDIIPINPIYSAAVGVDNRAAPTSSISWTNVEGGGYISGDLVIEDGTVSNLEESDFAVLEEGDEQTWDLELIALGTSKFILTLETAVTAVPDSDDFNLEDTPDDLEITGVVRTDGDTTNSQLTLTFNRRLTDREVGDMTIEWDGVLTNSVESVVRAETAVRIIGTPPFNTRTTDVKLQLKAKTLRLNSSVTNNAPTNALDSAEVQIDNSRTLALDEWVSIRGGRKLIGVLTFSRATVEGIEPTDFVVIDSDGCPQDGATTRWTVTLPTGQSDLLVSENITITASPPAGFTHGSYALRLKDYSIRSGGSSVNNAPKEDINSTTAYVDGQPAVAKASWSNLEGGKILSGELSFSGADVEGVNPSDFELWEILTHNPTESSTLPSWMSITSTTVVQITLPRAASDLELTLTGIPTGITAGSPVTASDRAVWTVTFSATVTQEQVLGMQWILRAKYSSQNWDITITPSTVRITLATAIKALAVSDLTVTGIPNGVTLDSTTKIGTSQTSALWDLTFSRILSDTELTALTISAPPTPAKAIQVKRLSDTDSITITAKPPDDNTHGDYSIRLKTTSVISSEDPNAFLGTGNAPAADDSGRTSTAVAVDSRPIVATASWSQLRGGIELSGRITFSGAKVEDIAVSDFVVIDKIDPDLPGDVITEQNWPITIYPEILTSTELTDGTALTIRATPPLGIDNEFALRLKATSIKSDDASTDNAPAANSDSTYIAIDTIYEEAELSWSLVRGGYTLSAQLNVREANIVGLTTDDVEVLKIDPADSTADPVTQTDWFLEIPEAAIEDGNQVRMRATPPFNTEGTYKFRLKATSVRSGGSPLDNVPTNVLDSTAIRVDNTDQEMEIRWRGPEYNADKNSFIGYITFNHPVTGWIEVADFMTIAPDTPTAADTPDPWAEQTINLHLGSGNREALTATTLPTTVIPPGIEVIVSRQIPKPTSGEFAYRLKQNALIDKIPKNPIRSDYIYVDNRRQIAIDWLDISYTYYRITLSSPVASLTRYDINPANQVSRVSPVGPVPTAEWDLRFSGAVPGTVTVDASKGTVDSGSIISNRLEGVLTLSFRETDLLGFEPGDIDVIERTDFDIRIQINANPDSIAVEAGPPGATYPYMSISTLPSTVKLVSVTKLTDDETATESDWGIKLSRNLTNAEQIPVTAASITITRPTAIVTKLTKEWPVTNKSLERINPTTGVLENVSNTLNPGFYTIYFRTEPVAGINGDFKLRLRANNLDSNNGQPTVDIESDYIRINNQTVPLNFTTLRWHPPTLTTDGGGFEAILDLGGREIFGLASTDFDVIDSSGRAVTVTVRITVSTAVSTAPTVNWGTEFLRVRPLISNTAVGATPTLNWDYQFSGVISTSDLPTVSSPITEIKITDDSWKITSISSPTTGLHENPTVRLIAPENTRGNFGLRLRADQIGFTSADVDSEPDVDLNSSLIAIDTYDPAKWENVRYEDDRLRGDFIYYGETIQCTGTITHTDFEIVDTNGNLQPKNSDRKVTFTFSGNVVDLVANDLDDLPTGVSVVSTVLVTASKVWTVTFNRTLTEAELKNIRPNHATRSGIKIRHFDQIRERDIAANASEWGISVEDAGSNSWNYDSAGKQTDISIEAAPPQTTVQGWYKLRVSANSFHETGTADNQPPQHIESGLIYVNTAWDESARTRTYPQARAEWSNLDWDGHYLTAILTFRNNSVHGFNLDRINREALNGDPATGWTEESLTFPKKNSNDATEIAKAVTDSTVIEVDTPLTYKIKPASALNSQFRLIFNAQSTKVAGKASSANADLPDAALITPYVTIDTRYAIAVARWSGEAYDETNFSATLTIDETDVTDISAADFEVIDSAGASQSGWTISVPVTSIDESLFTTVSATPPHKAAHGIFRLKLKAKSLHTDYPKTSPFRDVISAAIEIDNRFTIAEATWSPITAGSPTISSEITFSDANITNLEPTDFEIVDISNWNPTEDEEDLDGHGGQTDWTIGIPQTCAIAGQPLTITATAPDGQVGAYLIRLKETTVWSDGSNFNNAPAAPVYTPLLPARVVQLTLETAISELAIVTLTGQANVVITEIIKESNTIWHLVLNEIITQLPTFTIKIDNGAALTSSNREQHGVVRITFGSALSRADLPSITWPSPWDVINRIPIGNEPTRIWDYVLDDTLNQTTLNRVTLPADATATLQPTRVKITIPSKANLVAINNWPTSATVTAPSIVGPSPSALWEIDFSRNLELAEYQLLDFVIHNGNEIERQFPKRLLNPRPNHGWAIWTEVRGGTTIVGELKFYRTVTGLTTSNFSVMDNAVTPEAQTGWTINSATSTISGDTITVTATPPSSTGRITSFEVGAQINPDADPAVGELRLTDGGDFEGIGAYSATWGTPSYNSGSRAISATLTLSEDPGASFSATNDFVVRGGSPEADQTNWSFTSTGTGTTRVITATPASTVGAGTYKIRLKEDAFGTDKPSAATDTTGQAITATPTITYQSRTAFTLPAGWPSTRIHGNFTDDDTYFYFGYGLSLLAYTKDGLTRTSSADITLTSSSFGGLPVMTSTDQHWGLDRDADGNWLVLVRNAGTTSGFTRIAIIYIFNSSGTQTGAIAVPATISSVPGETFRAPKGVFQFGTMYYTRVVRSVSGSLRVLIYDSSTSTWTSALSNQSANTRLSDMGGRQNLIGILQQSGPAHLYVYNTDMEEQANLSTSLDANNTQPWAMTVRGNTVYIADRGGYIYQYADWPETTYVATTVSAITVTGDTLPSANQTGSTVSATITFAHSIPATELTSGDFTLSNSSASIAITETTGNYSTFNLTITQPMNSSGTYTVSLNANAISAGTGYLAGPATAYSLGTVTFDTRSAVTVSSDTLPATNQTGATVGATITFDRSVTGLTATDFALTGGATIAVTGEGGTRATWTLTITQPTNSSGTYTVSLNANAISTTSTYLQGPATAYNLGTVTYDTRSAVAVSSFTAPTGDQTGTTSTFVLTLNRSVTKTEVTTDDFSSTAGTISSVSGRGAITDATVFDVAVTNPSSARGTYTVTFAQNAIPARTGVNGYLQSPASASTSGSVTYDTRNRTAIAVDSFSAPTGTQTGASSIFRLDLNYVVPTSEITIADFSGATITAVNPSSGSASIYDITATNPTTASGTYQLTFRQNAVTGSVSTDYLTGPTTAQTSTAVTYDTRADLTASWTTVPTGTQGSSSAFIVTFSHSVPAAQLTSADITVSNSASFAITPTSGSQTAYTVTVTNPANSSGSYTVSLAANAIAAGTTYKAGPSLAVTTSSVAFDTRTAVTVSSDTLPTGEQTGATFTATITFDRSVTGLTSGDFTLTQGATIAVSGSGATWNLTITQPTNYDGTYNVSLNANAIPQTTTTAYLAGPTTAYSLGTVDCDTRRAITASWSNVPTGTQTSSTATATLTFGQSIPANQLTTNDFTSSNSAVTITGVSPTTGSQTAYTITFTHPDNSSGSYTISLNADSVSNGTTYLEGPSSAVTTTSISFDTRSLTITGTEFRLRVIPSNSMIESGIRSPILSSEVRVLIV